MESISQLWEDIVRIKDAILIVIAFAVGSFYLGYDWRRPLPQGLPQTVEASVERRGIPKPLEVFEIGDIHLLPAELPNYPNFISDNYDALREDLRAMGTEHFRIFVAESTFEAEYFATHRFLEPEFPSYRLYLHTAYLERGSGSTRCYYLVKAARLDQRFRIELPALGPADRLLLVMAVSSKEEVPGDASQLKKLIKVTN